MTTKIIPISDLRRKTSQILNEVQGEAGVVYITQHGRPAMVLMDYDHYELLMAQLEDMSDIASLRAAEEESTRPYEEFLAEMDDTRSDEPVSTPT